MRVGRPTLDKKDSELRLRLNDNMRRWVEARSSRIGLSMSEYIRELIKADMKKRGS